MKYRLKVLVASILAFLIVCMPFNILADDANENLEAIIVSAEPIINADIEIYSKSAIIYERNSKTVLYEKF